MPTAAERVHRAAPQALWVPPGLPREEEEEGGPRGSRAVAEGQEDDRAEGQALPQAAACREDTDEEDVSTRRFSDAVQAS